MPEIELRREGEAMTLAQAHGRDFDIPDERRPLVVHLVRQLADDPGSIDPVAALCRQLTRRYRVRIVTCSGPSLDRAEAVASRTVRDGVEILVLSGTQLLAPKAFRYIADADVVHVHGVDYTFDALAWTRFLHRRTLVASPGEDQPSLSGHAAIRSLWFKLVTRLSCRAYSHIVCSSERDRRVFDAIVDHRATMIGSGADVAKFANCAALDARRRIVTVGSLASASRLDRLLDVMQVLAPRHPDWHLDIIGVPSDLDGATLEADIRARGLSKHVALQVAVDDGSIRNTMARASLFASATDAASSTLSVIEAMSAGLLPVLDSNDAFRALAKTHPALMLTDYSGAQPSAKTFEAAFARLVCQGTGIREELIGTARSYAWDKVADRYGAVYDAVLVRPALAPVRLHGELA